MIAEWHAQWALLVTWPHGESDWRDTLNTIEPVYVEICLQAAKFQRVVVLCLDHPHTFRIRKQLREAGCNLSNVSMEIIETNDTWIRDYGPIGVNANGQLQLQHWRFDGWGGKFPAELDNAVTEKLWRWGVLPESDLTNVEYVLEGGSIDSNGNGLLLTTYRCLIDYNRNKTADKNTFLQALKENLKIDSILWLRHGYLEGDDTDGHIDTLARFVDEYTIVYVQCEEKEDPQFHELYLMERDLKQLATEFNLNIVALPLPEPCFDADGNRLPATYTNFTIINDAVLAPVYNDKNDLRALAILAECFPGREIVPINALPLITQGGSIHCATAHIPLLE